MPRRTIGGRYELDPNSSRAGGMGEVLFGFDTRLDRPVAVKFIQRMPADKEQRRRLVQRFVRESRITARLEHPGVPAVYDYGTQDGEHYLVMQLIDGASLTTVLHEVKSMPVAWAAAIAAQVCSVLAAAHASSLVHRDLKPGNLMLCPDGTVKVLDFGIAAARVSYEPSITHEGAVVGTPDYMAPEQAELGVTSPQCDLYAVGVLLDEMLTGRNQFLAGTVLATMRNQVAMIPRPVRDLRPDAPEDLERLVLRLLAKSPEDRPSSATSVYFKLAHHCRELPPLPGFVNPDVEHPVRMYAAVVGGVGRARPTSIGRRRTATLPNGPRGPASPEEVARAKEKARRLKGESRYVQAMDTLARIIERMPAAESLRLRIELADLRLQAGDYLAAAMDFSELSRERGRVATPADPEVLRCRYLEARCHSLLGNSAKALDLLCSLLDDERSYGVDDKHVTELRRQISQLELGVNMSLRPYIRRAHRQTPGR